MTAVVHIGPFGGKRELIQDFYSQCPVETMGPGRWSIVDTSTFDTLEQLIDHIDARTEAIHVVVCHGNDASGLLCKFVTGAKNNATGALIGDLATAAGRSGLDAANSTIKDLAAKMGATTADALRLVSKLAKLKKRNIFLEFRGCNVGKNPTMLRDYGRAFHAASVCAPDCRMFYLRTTPAAPPRGRSVASLMPTPPSSQKVRRRLFRNDSDATLAAAGPLLVKIEDIDGHTKVTPSTVLKKPNDAADWALALNGVWRRGKSGPLGSSFVFQVMWEDTKPTFWTCLEPEYRMHLVRV